MKPQRPVCVKQVKLQGIYSAEKKTTCLEVFFSFEKKTTMHDIRALTSSVDAI